MLRLKNIKCFIINASRSCFFNWIRWIARSTLCNVRSKACLATRITSYTQKYNLLSISYASIEYRCWLNRSSLDNILYRMCYCPPRRNQKHTQNSSHSLDQSTNHMLDDSQHIHCPISRRTNLQIHSFQRMYILYQLVHRTS